MIARTEHPGLLNEVANDPRVRPFMGGDGHVDLTAIVCNPRNVILTTTRGGFLARALGDGRYDVHAVFRPGGPKQHALRAMREALHYMFMHTDAVELLAGIPCRNRAARSLARLAGFEPRLCYALPWSGDTIARMEMSVLTISTWMARTRRKEH